VFSFDCDADTVACIGGGIAEELFGGTGLDNKAILKKYLSSELYGYISELL
jgi:ADP-ribosylglycohydrolase